MARSPSHFDEELLSGYLDGTLSQREAQRARLHLEENAESRRLFAEMRALRQSALETRFSPPEDRDWPELPKTRSSRLSRSLGWLLLVVWLVVVSGLALWRFLSQTGDPLEIFLVLGLPGAFVLLFLSVLLDRLKDLTTDRYRDVHR
ncbi:MAG: zf-HC2 domain-containing protein [Holophagales bacterium]|nr:zf-HC2 domain-containing protein [Holophagales bacterium]